jgi:hypothetical protein
MINVASWSGVGPLGEFRVCPYLIMILRAMIAETLPEDQRDDADVWLAPLAENEINPLDGRVRLCFMIGSPARVLCRVPLRSLLIAESSTLSRCN